MSYNAEYTQGLYNALAQAAAVFPSKVAVIFGAQQITYGELIGRVDTVALGLRQRYANARRFAVHLANNSDLIELIFALAKLGLTAIPLNPALRKSQLLTQVEACNADVIVTSEPGMTLWQRIAPQLPCITLARLNYSATSGVAECVPCNADAPFIVTLSSGSTGAPKPIVLSQHSKLLRSQQAAQSYAVSDDDVVLCASPFFHSLGQRLVLLPLVHGATLVILEHFSSDQWLTAVERHRVSFTIAVASHLHALQEALIGCDSRLASLRCLVSSSALLNESLKARLLKNIGCEFHEMYGATEVATATNLTPSQAKRKPRSVGAPLPNVRLAILSDDQQPQAPRVVGEIAVQTPCVFQGYLEQPQQTQRSFHDNYFLTGDLGYLDDDGFLYFVSRKKDIIITGGSNVIPSDIETQILAYPGIKDCCVIGINHDYLGEVVFAVCVAEPEIEPNDRFLQGLRLAINETLAGFQQPRDWVFIDALPLTGSGKPDKQALRATYHNRLSEGAEHV